MTAWQNSAAQSMHDRPFLTTDTHNATHSGKKPDFVTVFMLDSKAARVGRTYPFKDEHALGGPTAGHGQRDRPAIAVLILQLLCSTASRPSATSPTSPLMLPDYS